MKPGLKQRVVDLVESKELDDAQLRRLDATQRKPAAASLNRWAVAAALLLGLTVALSVIVWPGKPENMTYAIADEVAMNHLKRRPLEVAGQSLDEVRAYFNELDFQLLEDSSATLAMGGLQGGRYCSIQGKAAAQLRLRDKADHMQTYYQAPYDKALFGDLPDVTRGQQPAVVEVRGLTVYVWTEKGLLFALATE